MNPSDLYGLPLERFTSARNDLAKELRQAGRRDDAAALAKLRKPTVAAWAVNQLVRTQRRDLTALFEAGDALQKAQLQMMRGRGEREEFRSASDAERAAVDRLTEKAQGLLDADGHEPTAATLDRVAETLHAAALDHEARTQVAPGTLERELRHVGLGDLATAPAPAAPGRGARLKAARSAEAKARFAAEQTARELREAEQRRDEAARELREAENALRPARQRAEEAAAAYEQAKRELEEAERDQSTH